MTFNRFLLKKIVQIISWIILTKKKVFPTEQIADAKLEPINIQKKELPKIAPYLCYKS